MRIKYASDMRMQCAFRIRKWCAYLNAFHMRIKNASMIPTLTLIQLIQDMRFQCISDAHQKCWNALMQCLKRFKCVSCSMGPFPCPVYKSIFLIFYLSSKFGVGEIKWIKCYRPKKIGEIKIFIIPCVLLSALAWLLSKKYNIKLTLSVATRVCEILELSTKFKSH